MTWLCVWAQTEMHMKNKLMYMICLKSWRGYRHIYVWPTVKKHETMRNRIRTKMEYIHDWIIYICQNICQNKNWTYIYMDQNTAERVGTRECARAHKLTHTHTHTYIHGKLANTWISRKHIRTDLHMRRVNNDRTSWVYGYGLVWGITEPCMYISMKT